MGDKSAIDGTKRGNHWKGGRIVDPRGYVLVWMPGHRLADKRGYVYEHRLVAEQKLGRELRAGEEVHHENEAKGDNRAVNLQTCDSKPQHRRRHARRADLRPLGSENSTVQCACGCGKTMDKYDKWSRPRLYVSGHNLR